MKRDPIRYFIISTLIFGRGKLRVSLWHCGGVGGDGGNSSRLVVLVVEVVVVGRGGGEDGSSERLRLGHS